MTPRISIENHFLRTAKPAKLWQKKKQQSKYKEPKLNNNLQLFFFFKNNCNFIYNTQAKINPMNQLIHLNCIHWGCKSWCWAWTKAISFFCPLPPYPRTCRKNSRSDLKRSLIMLVLIWPLLGGKFCRAILVSLRSMRRNRGNRGRG